MTTRRWITAAAMALATMAVANKAGVAQDYRGHNRDREQQGDERNRWNHRFSDHDRQATRSWFDEHRRNLPRGLRRKDRLPPGFDSHLRVGVVLEPSLRSRMYVVPFDLLYQLPPVPYGFRYTFIGGRIVLIDPAYHVLDVMWVDQQYQP